MQDSRFTLEDQVVLISGGSQGLGKQFAAKYYRETVNSKIILVSRGAEKLISAVDEITGGKVDAKRLDFDVEWSERDRIGYIPCDLSDRKDVARLFDVLAAKKIELSQVLACAGGSTPKLFRDLTDVELEAGVKMNYLTVLFLSHKVAQRFPRCHLVLFSSETSFFPFIGYAQYAPLKGSVKSLTSILRQEMPEMRISCVYPGNFDSEGYAVEETTKPSITKEIEGASALISCEECCNRIVRWLHRGYDDITVDFIGWVLMSTDMGLNKHNNRSFLWFVQLLIGTFANFLIVPIYMLFCSSNIKKWHKNQDKGLLKKLQAPEQAQ
ncbi:hypothetical protein HG537_0A07210 [Torulaspora globosa]|uniref:3-ketodihydrosphingosine reductase TSC10 n=1 Tax=Torulaspora globosa TaxID=48254 RepID=A0A7H9HKW8_9SACH|nr:hypothetical protein HG537_0A07210 [Torulaspora sp. CBS 2947]